MTLDNILKEQKYLEILCIKENIKKLSIFGSILRGDYTIESDIDFLVEFDGSQTFFQILNLKYELENFFKVKVDLVTPDSLSKYFKEDVLKEAKIIYEA